METFVDQRSRTTPPSVGYTTLENVLDQKEKGNQLKATCSGVTDERTDKQFLARSYEALNVG